MRGVETPKGLGFGEPVELVSGSSPSVCRVVGECSSGSGSWTSMGGAEEASGGSGVVKLRGNRPTSLVAVRP